MFEKLLILSRDLVRAQSSETMEVEAETASLAPSTA
jgi:hypothetical protein